MPYNPRTSVAVTPIKIMGFFYAFKTGTTQKKSCHYPYPVLLLLPNVLIIKIIRVAGIDETGIRVNFFATERFWNHTCIIIIIIIIRY